MNRDSLIEEMTWLVQESKSLADQLKDKLREISTATKHSYKSRDPEDLSDDLEELLRQANLSKPKVLDTKQYHAVAEVWELLSGGELSEVGEAVDKALEALRSN